MESSSVEGAETESEVTAQLRSDNASNYPGGDSSRSQEAVQKEAGVNKSGVEPDMSPEVGCSNSPLIAEEGGDPSFDMLNEQTVLGDVEKFDGKIVYNPDGSAYIIEGDDVPFAGELPLKQEGSIVEDRDTSATFVAGKESAYPRIASAFFVSRNPFYQALSQGYLRLLNDKNKVPDAPVVHSYRVYTLRDPSEDGGKREEEGLGGDHIGPTDGKSSDGNDPEKAVSLNDSSEFAVPIKPILMCFICKLSFGYVKSFITHAMTDHKLSLNVEEKGQLARKNTSAVIQCVGKDRGPLLSFLEPVPPSQNDNPTGTPSEGSAHSPGANSMASSNSFARQLEVSPNMVMNQLPGVDESPSMSEDPTKRGGIQIRNVTELLTDNALDEILRSSSASERLDGLSGLAEDSVLSDGENKPIFPTSSPGSDSLPSRLSGSSSGSQKSALQIPSPPRPRLPMVACPEHMNGKPPGKECSNCDLIINSQLGNQQLNLMQSRNSCKTLKCPKCNWHYKYQETLEIHMKEKHPDHETTCMYCIMNQPHPRLSRGESYTCGYKPYRCDVCNYSTTTKGNLSIHMQSDKHLNNMQELQQSGAAPPAELQVPAQPSTRPSPPPPMMAANQQKAKPKSTWRCDVCNYETNVARNLRIHMTSEKHTHNLILLQQNVKQMQHLSNLQAAQQGTQQPGFDPAALLLQMVPGMNAGGSGSNGQQAAEKPMQQAEAALADMAYSQALLLQLMASGQMPPNPQQLPMPGGQPSIEGDPAPQMPPHLPEILDQGDPVEPNPPHMFHCCICAVFSTDNLDALNRHLTADRSKACDDVLMVVVGNYICKLCSYKTNLKANFQLHCKTDKHLQKLQHVNHIREGGPKNEWRLKFLSVNQPVQVRCNACDFYGNSTHKLSLHTQVPQHNIGTVLWWHLKQAEESMPVQSRLYSCSLCNFSSPAKMNLVRHVRSIRHLQMEQLYQMRRRQEGIESAADISLIFLVTDASETMSSDSGNQASRSNGDHCPSPGSRLDGVREGSKSPGANLGPKSTACDSQSEETSERERSSLPCPLCQESFSDQWARENHLSEMHHVTGDAMQRLLALADLTQKARGRFSEGIKPDPDELMGEQSDSETYEEFRCSTCSSTFSCVEDLASHQSDLGHLEMKETPQGRGYLCWKTGCNQFFPTTENLQAHFMEVHRQNQQLSVSEKHVYKYRCNQCSLAFKTLEKLQLHSQYHLIREATTCSLCGRTFRSIQALLKHQEVAHADVSEAEMMQVRTKLMNNPLLQSGLQGQALNPAVLDLLKIEASKEEESEDEPGNAEMRDEDQQDDIPQEQRLLEDYLNSQSVAEDNYNDPNRKYKCHKCKVAFTRQTYLTSHNKTLLHRKGEKLNYPMEKYLDPNRPFKCDICKESFTQKNILLVHYNSVSHLHKLKRLMKEQQSTSEGNAGGSPPPEAQQPADEDEEKKPYKCNICKVVYSQGSTLDIHLRSVLHQTRASKLHELALSGQIDLSVPLIEQPEPSKVGEGVSRDREAMDDESDEPQSARRLSPAEDEDQPMDDAERIYQSGGDRQNTEGTLVQNPSRSLRRSSLIHKQLLQNYGFEIVMQFLESRQKQVKETGGGAAGEEGVLVQTEDKQAQKKVEVPEMRESSCPICNKKFSSIWILRAHAEEIHRDLLPLPVVEKFSEEFRTLYEQRLAALKKEEEPQEDVTPKLSRSDLSPIGTVPGPNPGLQMSPGSLPQQLGDMNAAMQQMQHLNPMVMASLGLGMPPFGMNMQALAAMNLQPPLVPFMMNAAAQWDPMAALFGRPPQSGASPQMDPNFLLNQKLMQQQQQQQAHNPAGGQQKRARTRITDEQLKILRAHFDINNSPSEEQIKEMARQSGLPPKVIKHWFRNTLFKERQRNKDSPYNFNNPPSTSLNLEEYEKDGSTGKPGEEKPTAEVREPAIKIEAKMPTLSEALEDASTDAPRSPSPTRSEPDRKPFFGSDPSSPKQHTPMNLGSVISNQLNAGSSGRPQFPASFNALLSSTTTPTPPNYPTFGTSPVPLPARSDGSLTPTGSSQSYADMGNPSPSASSSGKRANRTRFTDYQIKVLQEFFENNAYPKDDDLEYLSKLLGLSPRVIVVWFQNARQKARKVYENQPPVDPNDEGAGRFQRTPGLNYQCKKCLLVFQRYYELIRHQKTHCFKEEDAKRSAQAQAAAAAVAAQAASSTGSEDSNSSSVADNSNSMAFPGMAAAFPGQQSSPNDETFTCDQCNLAFPRFDLWREHQMVHFMNPTLFNLFPSGQPAANEIRPMSTLDSKVQQLREQALAAEQQPCETSALMGNQTPQAPKRKLEESPHGGKEGCTPPEQHGKRLRTTILPEQLDYLYQKYQMESNPSRKALETIARDVGLKKRVVQVWFQNTRARERKGQYRAHAQVINKRCPFCPALFRVRSALETHLATKHPEQFSMEEINIDSLPDEESMSSNATNNAEAMKPMDSSADLQKFYGDSLKKYLAELEGRAKQEAGGTRVGEAPLDLSKPMDLTKSMKGDLDEDDLNFGRGCDDTRSETYSEMTDFYDGDDFGENSSSPSSPGLPGTSPNMLGNSSLQASPRSANKRYRTQMSPLQVKVMKMIFEDYKTPTMTECETLGHEIRLPKRVIQVWFQNARAKAKKSRMLQQNDGLNSDNEQMPEECKVCQVKYSPKYVMQDHLFTRQHIETVKAFLEEQQATVGSTNGGGGSVAKLNFTGDRSLLDSESSAEQFLAKLCSGALSGFPLGDGKFAPNLGSAVDNPPSFASATSAGS